MSQIVLNPNCVWVRAAEHAPRDAFRVLERRHGLAEVVERGTRVREEHISINRSHRKRDIIGRRRLQPLGRNAKSSKRGALCGPDRCDACALLTATRHTPATIRIVDRLYARDFELLGYQKVNARMMRLCAQRAARQAALASQQRLPVVRRKPKKYRGPTRTPPASQRNNAPQEEEFGRHMKKWLEGEQVPLMPTE